MDQVGECRRFLQSTSSICGPYMTTAVGKNGFEHNNLSIFGIKLHWVLQSFFGGSTWECVLLHEEMNIIY